MVPSKGEVLILVLEKTLLFLVFVFIHGIHCHIIAILLLSGYHLKSKHIFFKTFSISK
eukprot:UN14965